MTADGIDMSRNKSLRMALVSLAMAGAGIFLVFAGRDDRGAAVAGWASIVFFGLGAVVLTMQAFGVPPFRLARPGIGTNAEGFVCRGRLYRWTDVGPFVAEPIRTPLGFTRPIVTFELHNARFVGKGRLPDVFDESPRELAERLNEARTKALGLSA